MVSNVARRIRTKRGMSISELARRTKLSRVTISNVENEIVVPSLETALLISKELEHRVEEIFFLDQL